MLNISSGSVHTQFQYIFLLFLDAHTAEERIVELFKRYGFKRQKVDSSEKPSDFVLFIQLTKPDRR